MRRGAIVLAVLVVVLGAVAAIAFDALFETFHELFFPAGSFDFAASSKLIQLFPDQFWFETSLLLGSRDPGPVRRCSDAGRPAIRRYAG